MKVLLVNKFHFLRGGAEKVYFQTAELLRAQGHEVVEFAMQHPSNIPSDYAKYFVDYVETEKPSFWQSLKLLSTSIYSHQAAKNIEQLILDTRPDVAHIHNIYHQISPSILPVLKKHNIPVILTAHDYKLVCPSYHLQADCPKNIFAHAWHCFINKKHKDSYAASLAVAWEWLIHKLGRVYERNIDMVVAPSKFVAEKLVAYGWPEDKVKVVPNFSDLPVLTEEKPPGHYVLFVGRLSPEKGHDVLIQTAQALPHVPFIVVGEYEDQNTPILPNVQYVGFRTGIELTEIYRQARALFVPSLAQETFGLNVIEAALQKVPAIVSNKGALPEIVINGGTGYVFDVERMHAAVEYITELWSNPDVGDYLGRAAQAQAIAKFTPEAVWPQLFDLYCSFHTK